MELDLKEHINNFILGETVEEFKDYSVYNSLHTQEANQKYIYNEISLQHELGEYLRKILNKDKDEYIVQFERNISDLGYNKKNYKKKEIDIVIFNKKVKNDNYAIELKFHKEENGRYTNTTYECVKDIEFLDKLVNYKNENESLIQKKFKKAYCVAIVDSKSFYTNSRAKSWNYWCFRENVDVDINTEKRVIYSGSSKKQKAINIEELEKKGYLPIKMEKGKKNSGWMEILDGDESKYYIVEID